MVIKKWVIYLTLALTLVILVPWGSWHRYKDLERIAYDKLEAELKMLHREIEKAENLAAFVPADTVVVERRIIRYLALCTIYNDAITSLGKTNLYHNIIGNEVKVYHLRIFFSHVNNELRLYPMTRCFVLYNGTLPWHYVLGIRKK